jgi:hypothetical protein
MLAKFIPWEEFERARKEYLSASKSKKTARNKRRKVLRKQLGYLKRNLKSIEKLNTQTSLLKLTPRQYKNLLVIHEVYRQQQWLYAVDPMVQTTFQCS